MAWAQGPVTDYNDFLTKLMQYASGTNPSGFAGTWTTSGVVPSGQQWTILANSIPAGGGGLTTSGTAYLQGQGSVSGDDIIVGLRTYNNASSFIFGVEIKGYTAYNSGLTFTTQPGASPSQFMAMVGVAFTAFFYVNGRRIFAVARLGGIFDVNMHAGFFLPYGTRNQYPYPHFISGSVPSILYADTQNDFGQSSIPDPGFGSTATFRWIDGTWPLIQHFGSTGGIVTTGTWALYPLRDAVASDGAEFNNLGLYSENQLIQGWTVGGPQLSATEVNAYPMFPIVINSNGQFPGQLDGIYYVPGNGLNPGDTITDQNSVVYDVFHNCWRSTSNAFYAVARG